MDLDADDGSQSDMLYVENGTSDKQTLAIKNISTLDKEMEPGDAVRFATVKNPGLVLAAAHSSPPFLPAFITTSTRRNTVPFRPTLEYGCLQ